MNIVIFAGGSGRRLWPISRQKSPKQFEPIVGSKSTLQMSVDRVLGLYDSDQIFVSTNQRYLEIVKRQLPILDDGQFIGEPARRDLAAAVGLSMLHLQKAGKEDEPVAILWGDNYMTEVESFQSLLKTAEGLIEKELAQIIFLGESARFANNNLGWIGLGKKLGQFGDVPYFAFKSWSYRPSLEECERMFSSGEYVWNMGYFVSRPSFVLSGYREYQPEMWAQLNEIGDAIGRPNYQETLQKIYPTLESISFDDAIVKNIGFEQAVVLHGTTGWSDPGTLYALKESINPDPEVNVTLGMVKAHKSKDCLLFNYDAGKLLAVAGLEGMIVVNTKDALVVVHKNHIGLVKELVDDLSATDLESYS